MGYKRKCKAYLICGHASWIVNEEDAELPPDFFILHTRQNDMLESNKHAVPNTNASLGYSRDGEFIDMNTQDFEKCVIRKLTRDPGPNDALLDVEIMRRLTWTNQ